MHGEVGRIGKVKIL